MKYRWNIFWADLNPTKGSEQSGTRPVLVISDETINQVLPIVTIISLTSLKPNRKVYSTEVLLEKKYSGLSMDSIAMAHQIRALSKDRLAQKCGEITDEEIREEIKKAIRIYLDI